MPDYAIAIENRPVKNYWPTRGPHQPLIIVEQMIQGRLEEVLPYFNNDFGIKVSVHYGVAKDGRIWQFVQDEDTAWSNGILQQPDLSLDWLQLVHENNINPNLITLAIAHEGNSGENLTEAQYEATLALHRRLIEHWGIMPDGEHIIGHDRLDSVERGLNPGPAFPWQRLLGDLNNANEPESSILEVVQAAPPEETLSFDLDDYAIEGEEQEPQPEPPTQTAEEANPLDEFKLEEEVAWPSQDASATPDDNNKAEVSTASEDSTAEEAAPEKTIEMRDWLNSSAAPEATREFDLDDLLVEEPPTGAGARLTETLPEDQGGTIIRWASLGGGVISVELANIRQRPSYEPATIMRQVTRGTRLHFDGYAEGPEVLGSTRWLHVGREDGYGWINAVLVTLDKEYSF